MRIEIREESVIIDGYVNAVERESKPLAKPGRQRKFVEKIKAERRVCNQACKAENRAIRVLLNHDEKRECWRTHWMQQQF